MPPKKPPVFLSPLDENFGAEFGQRLATEKILSWVRWSLQNSDNETPEIPTLGIRWLGSELDRLLQLSLYLDFVPNKELLLKLSQQDLMFLNSFKFDNKDILAGSVRY